MLKNINNIVGKRIKAERIALKRNEKSMTQTGLADYMDCGRLTIGNWESGKSYPTIEELRKLGSLFHCDVQYLLGEQECRTREQADMQEVLGLSRKAIENICRLQEADTDMQPDGIAIFALNKLLENPNIVYLLSDIGIFLENLKRRDTESIDYYESSQYRKDAHTENRSEIDFLSGKTVTLSNREYQEYWEQHTTREIMDFLRDIAQKAEKDDWDFPLDIEKED